jgi:predicted RNA polymerase sigma factor
VLAMETRVALTLRMVGGLTLPEIARAFLVQETTVGQRITRAKAKLDGPEVALAAVDRLEDKLAGYHAYHATRADLLRRLGCSQKSRAAYDKAIELAGNTAETACLTRRRDKLG